MGNSTCIRSVSWQISNTCVQIAIFKEANNVKIGVDVVDVPLGNVRIKQVLIEI